MEFEHDINNIQEQNIPHDGFQKKSLFRKSLYGIGFLISIAFCIFLYQICIPIQATKFLIYIDKGTSLTTIAKNLEDNNVVQSAFLFRNSIVFFNQDSNIIAGTYLFDHPANLFEVIHRVTTADYQTKVIKVTFPEGSTVREMAQILGTKFSPIYELEFEKQAIGYEGYLFPDTYFFLPDETIPSIITKMRDNFTLKTKTVREYVLAHNLNEKRIITMASILEQEVKTPEDMKIVSGLFWNRIKLGIPLQSDATLTYVTGKTSAELTVTDLKNKGDYNSYLNKDLPPTPIGNPGIVAIEAAVHPTKTDYLYFLSGPDGKSYFAKTFAEHVRNKRLYLK